MIIARCANDNLLRRMKVSFLACGSEIYDFIENNSEKVFEESRETFFKKFLLWGAGQRPANCASSGRRPR